MSAGDVTTGATDWGSVISNVFSSAASAYGSKQSAAAASATARAGSGAGNGAYPWSGLFGPPAPAGQNNTAATLYRQTGDMSFNWQALVIPLVLAAVGIVILKKVL